MIQHSKNHLLHVLAFVSLLLIAPAAFAQVSESTLLGKVQDSSGAVLPGADIELLSKATGAKRNTKTSDDGSFRITSLQPGQYDVTVSHTGFAKQTQPVVLLVGQTADINFALGVTTSASVDVNIIAPAVETDTVTLHNTITPAQVSNLPIDGRDFSTLATLVPGATTGNTALNTNYDPTKKNIPAISINGQSGRNLYMTIDGGDNTDIFMGGQNIALSLEAVQEFEVITQDPKAQFGRGIGGVVNVITKSGSNAWHGSGFGFFRDDAYQSIDAISEQTGKPKPPFSSRQYGGTVGGPIVHDRAFFFYSYERQQQDRSRVFNSGGAFPTLDGTATAQPFRQNLHLGKLDLQLTASQKLSARYAEQDNRTTNEFFSDFDAPNSAANEHNKLHDLVVAHTTVLGSNKVNDLRYHYAYWQNAIQDQHSSNDVPTIILPAASFGASQAGTQAPREITHQVSDDFSWTIGRNSLRFGANFVVQPHEGISGDFRHNRYTFKTNDYDPVTNTIGATNKLANYRSWASPDFNIVNRTLTQSGFYLQDDVRFGRLSLVAGLRYDYVHNIFYNRGTLAESLVRQFHGQVPGGPSNLNPSDPKADFAPRVGVIYDLSGNGKTIVRAGYARIYDPAAILASSLFANLEVTQADGAPPFDFIFVPGSVVKFFPGLSCATTPCQPTTFNAQALPFRFPIGWVNSPDLKLAHADQFNLGFSHELSQGLTVGVDAVYSRTRNLLQGRNLNFCINQDPICLSGTFNPAGVNFPGAGEYDPLDNLPRQIFLEDSTGRSDYTAAMFTVRKSLTKKWQLLANYTLSRAITDTAQFQYVVQDQLHPHALGELGPSPFDERHRAVISGSYLLPKGFMISTILTAATARPYTPALGGGGDINNDGVPTVFGAVNNGQGGSRVQNVADGDRTAGRGTLRGDPTFSWDARIAKTFSLERFLRHGEIETLFEVFNLTNKANFGANYFDAVTDPARFGRPINIITPPRTGQFGVKFNF